MSRGSGKVQRAVLDCLRNAPAGQAIVLYDIVVHVFGRRALTPVPRTQIESVRRVLTTMERRRDVELFYVTSDSGDPGVPRQHLAAKLNPVVAARYADRALCPISVANVLSIKVHRVAEAMRRADVEEPLTIDQVRAWRSMRTEPPAWYVELAAEDAARQARREHRGEMQAREDEHEMVVLWPEVEARILAGKPVSGDKAELIALDIVVRAMKDLVRADGNASALPGLELAALRWAGVDPADQATWFIRAGSGEEQRADEIEWHPSCDCAGCAECGQHCEDDTCSIPLAPDGHCGVCQPDAMDLTEAARWSGGAAAVERAHRAIDEELARDLGERRD